MKRSFGFLLTLCMILLSLTLVFASCDEAAEDTTPDEITTAEETTSENTTEAPHTHAWSDWSETTAATCLAEGLNERTCACGEKETQSIPALGHTEVVDAAVAPTCTSEGKTEGKHCSVCNAVTLPQNAIAALGHTEVVDAAVAPTCTSEGKNAGKHCSVCNAVTLPQYAIAALGHTEVVDAAVPATCTTPGLTEGKHCSVCKAITLPRNAIDALGHTEVVDAAVPATCTSTGLTEGKHCSVCNVVLKEQKETPISDHNFSDWKVGVAETCTTDGSRIRECVCGEKLERGVFAAHHYVYNGTTGKCSGCGDVVTYTDGLIFTLSDDQSYYIWTDITFHNDTTVTEIIVPPMYNGLPVKDIKVDARGLENLTRIVLPDGIESITKCWMQGSPSFASINFPDGLKTIGKGAFLISASETANLTDIRLPSTLTSINRSFLQGHSYPDNRYHKYISVAYGNPVYHSQDNCLIETQTKTLIMGTALSVIPTDGSVTAIGPCAFMAIPELTNVVIPDAITHIEKWAFYCCNNLESIHFGAGFTPGENFPLVFGQFSRHIKLNQITVSENNPVVYAVNNCLIEKASKTLLLGCNTSIIPSDGSVEIIGNRAFATCTFKTINIPITVKQIDDEAFMLSALAAGNTLVGGSGFTYDGIIYYEGRIEDWEKINIHRYAFAHEIGMEHLIPVICSNGETGVESNFKLGYKPF